MSEHGITKETSVGVGRGWMTLDRVYLSVTVGTSMVTVDDLLPDQAEAIARDLQRQANLARAAAR